MRVSKNGHNISTCGVFRSRLCVVGIGNRTRGNPWALPCKGCRVIRLLSKCLYGYPLG